MATFHEAIYYVGGTIEDMDLLLKEHPRYLRIRDENYKTLLIYASQLGRKEMVNFLFEKGANIKYLDMFPVETITRPDYIRGRLWIPSCNSNPGEKSLAKKAKLENPMYTKENIDALRSTEYLNFSGFGFEGIKTLPKGLKTFIIERISIDHLVGLPETLEVLNAQWILPFKGDLELPKKFPKGLKVLKLRHNQLREIKGSVCVLESLEVINIAYNNLKELPKLHNNLQHLNASSNFIEEIKNLPSMIKYVYLSTNCIERLCDLSGQKNLLTLDIGCNAVTEFPKLPRSLCELYLHKNYITGPFKNLVELPNIEEVNIRENYIKQDYKKELKIFSLYDQLDLKHKRKTPASTFFKFKNRTLLLCERYFNENSCFHHSYLPLDLFKFIFQLAGIKKKLSFQEKLRKYRERNDEKEKKCNSGEIPSEYSEVSTPDEDLL